MVRPARAKLNAGVREKAGLAAGAAKLHIGKKFFGAI